MTNYFAMVDFVSDCSSLGELVFSVQLGHRWGNPRLQDIVRLTERITTAVPRGVKRFGVAFDAHDLDEECLSEIFEDVRWIRLFTSLRRCEHVKLTFRLWMEPDMDWYSQWCGKILDWAGEHINEGMAPISLLLVYRQV